MTVATGVSDGSGLVPRVTSEPITGCRTVLNQQSKPHLMQRRTNVAVPVLQTTASVVIALFLLQLAKRLLANRQNTIAQGLAGGLNFILGS